VPTSSDTHPNRLLLVAFYEAFSKRDFDTMNKIYNPEHAVFYDPVFQHLNARDVRKMWKMLCLRGKDLTIKYQVISADDETGKAHWDAYYTFSGTGKKVINQVNSAFVFKDGLVVNHKDEFDLYGWCKQAFGLIGWLLGWTTWFKSKIRQRAKSSLDQFRD
jgi:hypothetical protein